MSLRFSQKGIKKKIFVHSATQSRWKSSILFPWSTEDTGISADDRSNNLKKQSYVFKCIRLLSVQQTSFGKTSFLERFRVGFWCTYLFRKPPFLIVLVWTQVLKNVFVFKGKCVHYCGRRLKHCF